MKKILLLFVTIAILFLLIPAQLLADTGTYKIDNYKVTLTPQSDGSVDIIIISSGQFCPGTFPGLQSGSRTHLIQLPAAV